MCFNMAFKLFSRKTRKTRKKLKSEFKFELLMYPDQDLFEKKCVTNMGSNMIQLTKVGANHVEFRACTTV